MKRLQAIRLRERKRRWNINFSDDASSSFGRIDSEYQKQKRFGAFVGALIAFNVCAHVCR